MRARVGQQPVTVTVSPPVATAPLTRAEWDAFVAAAAERQQGLEDAANRARYAARVAFALQAGELARPALPVMVPPAPPPTRWPWIVGGLGAVGAAVWWMQRGAARQRERVS